ncbi:hypothetical protein LILAB_10725 [Corallococcus macrosporus]|uniref:Uncharacterized protein n=1 Tax=Myxococcus fulvus (strain ATCC BAA-855 / HW-1) TaxID=483219 RepID=F8CNN9_MYXFH|nr:hypothetical protein LILAB_10725 [Corallococcus macrosporus]
MSGCIQVLERRDAKLHQPADSFEPLRQGPRRVSHERDTLVRDFIKARAL